MPFRLVLTEAGPLRWLGLARLTGSVREDSLRGGFPAPGRVDGRRRGRRIGFLKTMPENYVCDEDGKMTDLFEALAKEADTRDFQLSPHRIAYEGAVLDDGTRLGGQWRIQPTWVLAGEEVFQLAGEGTGTWSARRR
ncbi:MAG: hypothetical protein JNL12_19745 [Planctomycetes bacterium]|nr:hypothetical protein [Planctomycetota bacterium]